MACCGGFVGQVFGAVGDVVSAVTDTVSSAVDTVANVVDKVVEAATNDPLRTAANALAIATGQVELLPYINAGITLSQGGSPEDVLKSAAISYAGGQVGGAVAGSTGSAVAGQVAGGTAAGLLGGKDLGTSLTGGAIGAVSPTGLFNDFTSGTTSSTGTSTSGANNMADFNYYEDPYGFGQTYSSDITGGEGFNATISAPYTYDQILALTPETYSGTFKNPQLDSLIKGLLKAGGSAAQSAKSFIAQNPDLFQGGLQTAGGLLQTQASKDAALRAQQQVAQATGLGVAGSQFRPVGVTTAFGASNFRTDPTTGQLISAGYQPSAQIGQGVQSLMNLGQSYLAQSPEQVASQYMAKQQDLLAPSRERQMAQLQNQLFQTGRGGLSVGATGVRPSGAGGLGATTPETEAYYNALAQQDMALAAQAQQAGQQQTLFGAGLFGQAGNLEQLAQQPLALGASLGGQAANYGANAGRLGLTGTAVGATYGTGSAATTNPLAYTLGGLGSPTSTLGTGLMNWLTTNPSTTQPTNALNTGAYGTGLAGYQNAMADIYGTGSTSNLNYFGQPTQYSAY